MDGWNKKDDHYIRIEMKNAGLRYTESLLTFGEVRLLLCRFLLFLPLPCRCFERFSPEEMFEELQKTHWVEAVGETLESWDPVDS
jgi:hypothetical protein